MLLDVHDGADLFFKIRANNWADFYGNQKSVYCIGMDCYDNWDCISYRVEYPHMTYTYTGIMYSYNIKSCGNIARVVSPELS